MPITEIEELPKELIGDDWKYHTIKFHDKINELVRVVNKLNIDLNEITNIHKKVNKRITDK